MPELLSVKELSREVRDKLDITLWWVKGTFDTYVQVIDYKQQPPQTYNIPVEPPHSPNEVFKHPFAYMPEEMTVAIDGRGAE